MYYLYICITDTDLIENVPDVVWLYVWLTNNNDDPRSDGCNFFFLLSLQIPNMASKCSSVRVWIWADDKK